MNIGIIVWHLWKRLHKNKKIKTKIDQMLATVTRLLLALKLKIKRETIARGRERVVVEVEREQLQCCRVGGALLDTLRQQQKQPQYLSRT